MLNGKPGDSRAHDILHHQIAVFGPEIDALVREIDAGMAPEKRADLRALIESWPVAPDGKPADTAALRARLVALAPASPPPPAPMPAAGPIVAPALPPRPRPRLEPLDAPPLSPAPRRRRGSALAAIIGIAIGGLVGLPLGFLAYAVARTSGALPPALWSSDRAMWGIVVAVAALAALLGAVQGGAPTRLGHTLLIALLGFFLGSLVTGLVAGAVAFVLGASRGVPLPEGVFGLGPVFTLVPLAAVAGGAVTGLWTGWRAWRDWRA